jgi:hypothetical protein
MSDRFTEILRDRKWMGMMVDFRQSDGDHPTWKDRPWQKMSMAVFLEMYPELCLFFNHFNVRDMRIQLNGGTVVELRVVSE